MRYLEAVKEDVREWIENNKEELEERLLQEEEFDDEDDFKQFVKEWLENTLWNDDNVTGNGSGVYFMHNWDAEQMVLENPEEVKEALQEFCVDASTLADKFLDRDWHYFDVTARCFYLSLAIGEVVDEDFEEIESLWLYKYKED